MISSHNQDVPCVLPASGSLTSPYARVRNDVGEGNYAFSNGGRYVLTSHVVAVEYSLSDSPGFAALRLIDVLAVRGREYRPYVASEPE